MQGDRLAQPRGSRGLLEQPAELARGQRLMIDCDLETASGVPARTPASHAVGRAFHHCRNSFEDLRWQHHVPVLAALRLHDADDLLLTVDVARSQPHHFTRPQPATIGEAPASLVPSGSSPW